MNDFVELRTILATLRRWWWLLLGCTLLGVALGYGYSRFQPPIYRATTRLAVAQMVEANTLRFSDVETISQQLRTYADLTIRRPILAAVIQELALAESWETLQSRVRAVAQPESQILEITVDDPSAPQAQLIATQLAQQLLLLNAAEQKAAGFEEQAAFVQTQVQEATRQLQEGEQQLNILRTIQGTSVISDTTPPLWAYWLSPADGISAVDPSGERTRRLAEEIDRLERLLIEWDKSYNRWNTILQEIASFKSLTVVDPAYVDPVPVSPRLQLNTIAAGALGLLLALGLVGLFEGLDDKVKLSDDLRRFTKAPLLGAVRRYKGKTPRDKLLLYTDLPAVLNDYRLLHSKFQLMCPKLPKRILITSPGGDEGRSLLVANLGIVAAQFGYRTMIADADWHHPTQHELFQIANEKGLLQLLRNPTANTTVPMWTVNRLPNLTLLTSGGTHPHPLSTAAPEGALAVRWNQAERFGHVLTQLTGHADLILLDSPPLLTSAETVAVAGQVDGVILVLEPGKTKQHLLQAALFALEQANANLIGIVFNRTTMRLDNGFLHAMLPSALTRPALETTAPEPPADHGHVTAGALSPITGNQENGNRGNGVVAIDSDNRNGTGPVTGQGDVGTERTVQQNGIYPIVPNMTSEPPRTRVVLPMGQMRKEPKNGVPTAGATAAPKQIYPNQVALEQIDLERSSAEALRFSLADLGIATVTLLGKHSKGELPLLLTDEQLFERDAQLQLDLLLWLPTSIPQNGQKNRQMNGATAHPTPQDGKSHDEDPHDRVSDDAAKQTQTDAAHDLLEIRIDNVALGTLMLEQNGNQTVTLPIPALPPLSTATAAHILRFQLRSAMPTECATATAERVPETVVVIRDTSALLFSEEKPASEQ